MRVGAGTVLRRDDHAPRCRRLPRARRRTARRGARAGSAPPGPGGRRAVLPCRRPLRLDRHPQRLGRDPRTERAADHPARGTALPRRDQPRHPPAPVPLHQGGRGRRGGRRARRRLPVEGADGRAPERHRAGGVPGPADGPAVVGRRHAPDRRVRVHAGVHGAARVRGAQPAAPPLDRRRCPRRRRLRPRGPRRDRRRPAARDHRARHPQAGHPRRPRVPPGHDRRRAARALLRPGRRRCRAGRAGRVGLRRVRGTADPHGRRRRGRRAGGHELPHRELPGLPDRHLRPGPRHPGVHPGPEVRRRDHQPLRGDLARRRRRARRGHAVRRHAGRRPRARRGHAARTTGSSRSSGLERYEMAGVYYAATELEARRCAGAPVVVVGGGNSAGQAAMYLAEKGSPVCVVVRRPLEATMSTYLVDRIESHPRVQVHVGTTVTALHGEPTLERVTLVGPEAQVDVPCTALFSFIGAEPNSGWLDGVAVDEHGFVLTDRALDLELAGRRVDRDRAAARCPTRRAGPACSPSATSGPDRPSGSPRPSARARPRSARSTSTSRSRSTPRGPRRRRAERVRPPPWWLDRRPDTLPAPRRGDEHPHHRSGAIVVGHRPPYGARRHDPDHRSRAARRSSPRHAGVQALTAVEVTAAGPPVALWRSAQDASGRRKAPDARCSPPPHRQATRPP